MERLGFPGGKNGGGHEGFLRQCLGYSGEIPLDQLSGALLESAVPVVVFRIVPL